eukprot:GEMP01015918.1.p1 GENE.GEMP01015918.1~~GEMP01015918.1.p1  ORF type:complete len:567 (+),score=104.87 GEMP01015918.1:511-2211(+)
MARDNSDNVMDAYLEDPLKDRQVSTVEAPPRLLMTKAFLFSHAGKKINIEALRKHLRREGKLSQEALLELISRATEILHTEPNIVKLKDPITVVGDIHGQFYDLLKLLDLGGEPGGPTQYLFLGDFVDRGSFSIEVLIILFAYKVMHPKRIWFCRGNHECRQMTAFFNFRDECEYKYDVEVYNSFMLAFDALPLGAVINGKFLALHGGLSPKWVTIDDAGLIDRFSEPPREGIFCDMLWSDPSESPEEDPGKSRKHDKDGFAKNDVRGCAWFFNYNAAMSFIERNSLLSVIRAHEAQLEGYKMHKMNEATGFPSVITIFSAPNYCDVYGNKGAILKFKNNEMNILQFHVTPHPYHLPNFMSVFAWSMPFMVEKISEMLYHILEPEDGDDDHTVGIEESPLPDGMQATIRESLSKEANAVVNLAENLSRRLEFEVGVPSSSSSAMAIAMDKETSERLRMKVRSVARIAQMFATLREEHEAIIKLKDTCPASGLSPEQLIIGRDAITTEADKFGKMKVLDETNEKRPSAKAIAPRSSPTKPRIPPATIRQSHSSESWADMDSMDSLRE